ncbi:hypothetical protein [Pararhizobium haloflavum]|uniref:hypothetical protein n=1 Tax=Pararhizobium haloflavum TaxID=2037914 RepID=UPI000C17F8F4|nr:hypothetical protein [Pararhizobium haloflavum]
MSKPAENVTDFRKPSTPDEREDLMRLQLKRTLQERDKRIHALNQTFERSKAGFTEAILEAERVYLAEKAVIQRQLRDAEDRRRQGVEAERRMAEAASAALSAMNHPRG